MAIVCLSITYINTYKLNLHIWNSYGIKILSAKMFLTQCSLRIQNLGANMKKLTWKYYGILKYFVRENATIFFSLVMFLFQRVHGKVNLRMKDIPKLKTFSKFIYYLKTYLKEWVKLPIHQNQIIWVWTFTYHLTAFWLWESFKDSHFQFTQCKTEIIITTLRILIWLNDHMHIM